MSYETNEVKEGRTVIDVKYTVTASLEFRTKQKAAKRRWWVLATYQRKCGGYELHLVVGERHV
jgi:hypothetical protein